MLIYINFIWFIVNIYYFIIILCICWIVYILFAFPAFEGKLYNTWYDKKNWLWKNAPLYQRELDRNGYNFTLNYDPPAKKKRCRNRRTSWFNPPYSLNVNTHIGGKFLKLLSKHFLPGHLLHPLLNRNTVEVSY